MKVGHNRFAEGPARRAEIIVVIALIALGTALRLIQYFGRGALWLDEAMLALSIVNRSPRALIFSPLEYNLVAPPLYLQITKAATLIAGPSEHALRFTALVSSLAALVAFAFLARKSLRGLEIPFAVLVFAISPSLVRYSGEVKQYSGDALAAVALTLVALKLRESRYSRQWVAAGGVVGLGVVWFSDPSTLVLGGLGIGIALLAWLEKDRKAFQAARVLAPVWCLAVLAAAWGSQRRMANGTSEVMHSLWKPAFIVFPPRSASESLWMWRGLKEISRETLGVRTTGGLVFAIGIFGIWSLWKRGRRDVVILLFAPFVVTVMASSAGVYPFAARLTLFLLPALIIGLAAGVGSIGMAAGRFAPLVAAALALFVLSPPSFIRYATTPSWLREEIPPVLAQVAANRKPGDRIFVFWGAAPAVAFYGPRYGIAPNEWVAGGLHGADRLAYLSDLDQFRGPGRLWMIFSHDREPGQREDMIRHLETFAYRDSTVITPPGRPDAATFLFDVPATR